MRIQTFQPPFAPASARRPAAGALRQLYFALLDEPLEADTLQASRQLLHEQLERAEQLPCDLPNDLAELGSWLATHSAKVGREYQDYRQARQAGAGRRYFRSKAQALYFLKGVAPTKLVDGAWLHGVLQHWQDPRFMALIRIYLEELGEGQPDKNHVLLYRKLLTQNHCEDWHQLSDEHYLQGALQLALGHHGAAFLPELIGFNLGYEQLPLHLLISAYELNELGIDPYYFTLHVTVDNAASGHAMKAVQSLLELVPRGAEAMEFLRRVRRGYQLNELGTGTLAVIDGFDLQTEVLDLLTAKGRIGQYLHSDYCRIAGRTVNDWLSDPERIPAFVEKLQSNGWIKRHQPPQNSRFWQLIEGERAEMFGVFNTYERQLIHDWILGDAADAPAPDAAGNPRRPRAQRSFRQQLRAGHDSIAARPLETRRSDDSPQLQARLASCASHEQLMAELARWMSPARHHSLAGLHATRLFSQALTDGGQ